MHKMTHARIQPDHPLCSYSVLRTTLQEYLTIDNTAQVGDTVENVLVVSTWYAGPPYHSLANIVIDSTVTISNNGVSVYRQYLHAEYYPAGEDMIFWQTGAGNSMGPIFVHAFDDGFEEVDCIRVQDECVFTVPYGLPGVPCDCPLGDPVGVGTIAGEAWQAATPNLSTGLFHLSDAAERITVYNAMGKLLFRGQGNRIDLSASPPGVYTALLHEKDLLLSVYDSSGRLVRARQLDMSGDDPRMDVFGVGPGLYQVTLSKGDRVYHGRMVVE